MTQNNEVAHASKTELEIKNSEDSQVVDQVTSVKTYLETLRKHPGGIKFGQYRNSSINNKPSNLELDNVRINRRFSQSNIHNGEICTSSSIASQKHQLINVQHRYNDKVARFNSVEYDKRNYLNRNMACTKTNAIKPVRISSSIKDIQGMLVSNLNAKTSYFNNSSDAALIVSESTAKKVDSNLLRTRNKNYLNTNPLLEEDVSSRKTVKAASSESSIFHNYGDSSHSNSIFPVVQSPILLEDCQDIPECLFNESVINEECNGNLAPGIR